MKKAFSLVELSIVILIIGIIAAGITQGSRLIRQSYLKTAQNLTQSSPVSSIEDLRLWYETSMETSFLSTESEDTRSISVWNDINPQGVTKNNAAGTTTTRPTYRENTINRLPAIRFDGTDDFMTFDGTILANTNYTIFVVEQRRDDGGGNPSYFFAGTNGITNNNLHIGYRDTDTITHAHYLNDLDYNISAYTIPIPRIHTFMFSTSAGKKYWMNGGVNPDASNASQTTALESYVGAALGRYSPTYYNGDIAEVIIFTRALKIEERQSVENYLSKKYAITL